MKKRKGKPEGRVIEKGRPFREEACRAGLVALAAVAVYLNTLTHGFVFDDIEGILNNRLVFEFNSLSQVLPILSQPWRAVTQFSYAITHYYFGFEPGAYHLFNIMAHSMNSVLVFGIAAIAAGFWLPEELRQRFALASGLIFAVHPINTEAVAYVWGRSSSLCAFFYFSSVVLVMQGIRESPGKRKWICYAFAMIAGVLAWKSKEEAITLPFLVAGLLFLRRSWRGMATALAAPLLILASRWADIGRLYSEVTENRRLVAAGAERAMSSATYFFTQVKCAVFYYLVRFVAPIGLNADPAVEPVTHPGEPLLILAALVLIILAICAMLLTKRAPVVTFGLMALLISPLSSYMVMPLADPLAEHRVYLTGLGFALLAGWTCTRIPRFSNLALCGIVLALGTATVLRNRVWADSLSLWTDAARKSPGLSRPHLNLGSAYQAGEQADAALEEYRKALAINPRLAPAYINMSAIYFARGDGAASEAALYKAIELSPELVAPYINLAIMALRRSQPSKALELLDRAGRIEDSHIVRFNRGEAYFQLGRYPEAIREYNRAVELKPDLREMREQVEIRLQKLRESGAIPQK